MSFHEGDLVEAVKGDRAIRDRICVTHNDPIFKEDTYLGKPSIFGLSSIDSYRRSGFTVTVIERAKPALPTEPFTTIRAVHLPAGNANTKITHLTLLPKSEGNPESRWSYSNGIRVDDTGLPRIKSFEVVAAPVAETAKKVLDAVRFNLTTTMRIDSENHPVYYISGSALDAIATEFGVTGELGE